MRWVIASLVIAGVLHLGLAQPAHTIKISAVPSRFSPDTIVLRAGETTQLVFDRIQAVHGIDSPDLGIPLTVLAEGQPVTLDVTPQKPGTYILHCRVVCGVDHQHMTLTVVVKP